MENLYNLIEKTAQEKGYKTITEYCRAVKIPRATMSELKSGRTKTLSAKTAQIIANTLFIPLEVLLGAAPDQKNPPAVQWNSEWDPVLNELIHELVTATEDDKKKILEIIRVVKGKK